MKTLNYVAAGLLGAVAACLSLIASQTDVTARVNCYDLSNCSGTAYCADYADKNGCTLTCYPSGSTVTCGSA